MPTLISEDPDSYNLDYYYKNYNDRFGLRTTESKIGQLRVLSVSFRPDSCSPSEQRYYFSVPLQPSIQTCYCGKYHTSFISQTYRIVYLIPQVNNH